MRAIEQKALCGKMMDVLKEKIGVTGGATSTGKSLTFKSSEIESLKSLGIKFSVTKSSGILFAMVSVNATTAKKLGMSIDSGELQRAVNEYKRYRALRNEAALRNDLESRNSYEDELQYWAEVLNSFNAADVRVAMNNNK